MRRVAVVAASFVAVIVAIAITLGMLLGSRAGAVGRSLYEHRTVLSKIHRRPNPAGPLVAWLGDSTLLNAPRTPSFATDVGGKLARSMHADSVIVAWFAFTFYNFYCLMGPVLEARPAVVIAVANLRLFGPHAMHFTDLCAMVPARELPRAITLPFGERGLTWPHLLLLRTLRLAPVEEGWYVIEGLRRMVADHPWWRALGQPERVLGDDEVQRRYPEVERRALRRYNVPIDEGRGTVRMMGEVVRLAVESGTRIVVVVEPIPYEMLRELGLYEPGRYRERIATLRRVVEGRGGILVDLHDVVPSAAFRDRSGHLGPQGVAIVSERLAPLVSDLLASTSGRPKPSS